MSQADDGDWSVELTYCTCWCKVEDGKIVRIAPILHRQWIGKQFSRLRYMARKVHKLNVEKTNPGQDAR